MKKATGYRLQAAGSPIRVYAWTRNVGADLASLRANRPPEPNPCTESSALPAEGRTIPPISKTRLPEVRPYMTVAAFIILAMISAAAFAAEPPPASVSKDDIDALKQKEANAKPEEPNPLNLVADEMVTAQLKLKQGLTDASAQKGQVNAIRLLEQLIELAKQQQQQQDQQNQDQQQQEREQQQQQMKPENTQTRQQENSTNPAQRSQESTGSGAAASPGTTPPGQKGIEWGNLPPRAREEFNQIMKEDFPETYKHLLELYFKNLSD